MENISRMRPIEKSMEDKKQIDLGKKTVKRALAWAQCLLRIINLLLLLLLLLLVNNILINYKLLIYFKYHSKLFETV